MLKTKPEAVWNLNACFDCCRPKVVSNKNHRRKGDAPLGLERWKYKVRLSRVRGYCLPRAQVAGQGRMNWNVTL
jgi:hypothetical protein